MKADIAEQWVAALRSGEFKQGLGALRDADNRLCCLGVLCELAVKAGVIEEGEAQANYAGDHAYGGSVHFLPDAVVEWAGTQGSSPAAENGSELIALNDGGLPFTKLADYIETDAEAL